MANTNKKSEKKRKPSTTARSSAKKHAPSPSKKGTGKITVKDRTLSIEVPESKRPRGRPKSQEAGATGSELATPEYSVTAERERRCPSCGSTDIIYDTERGRMAGKAERRYIFYAVIII